jgi:hypothetical protein
MAQPEFLGFMGLLVASPIKGSFGTIAAFERAFEGALVDLPTTVSRLSTFSKRFNILFDLLKCSWW